jgi:hypothetical protein
VFLFPCTQSFSAVRTRARQHPPETAAVAGAPPENLKQTENVFRKKKKKKRKLFLEK